MSKLRKKFNKKIGKAGVLVISLLLTIILMSVLHHHFVYSEGANFLVALSMFVVLSSIMLLHRASRCVFFLVIIQFSSSRGRSVVIAYTFALTFSGIGGNLQNNVKVLTGSIVCGEVKLSPELSNLSTFIPHRISSRSHCTI